MQLSLLYKRLGLGDAGQEKSPTSSPGNYNYEDYVLSPSGEKDVFRKHYPDPDYIFVGVPDNNNNSLIHALLWCFYPRVNWERIVNEANRFRVELGVEPNAFLDMCRYGRRILELIRQFYLSNSDDYTIKEFWTYGGKLQQPIRVGHGQREIWLWNSGRHYQVIYKKSFLKK
jgi:hypothetical protein